MCDCSEEKVRRFILQEADRIRKEEEIKRIEQERKVKEEQERKRRAEAARRAKQPYTKKEILGMSALAFLFLGLLYRGLGRRRSRKILAMIGLGWLIPRNPYCDPNPTINEARLKWPSSDVSYPAQNACCTCKNK